MNHHGQSDLVSVPMPARCAACGAALTQDEVDIGVGIQRGPWYCTECGWSEIESFVPFKDDGDDL